VLQEVSYAIFDAADRCRARAALYAENNLTHCYYFSVHCRKDGDIRVATEEAPSHERYPCPLCRALCHSCLLGEGGTVRALPFWSRPQDSFSHTEAGRRLWLDIKNSRTQHRDA